MFLDVLVTVKGLKNLQRSTYARTEAPLSRRKRRARNASSAVYFCDFVTSSHYVAKLDVCIIYARRPVWQASTEACKAILIEKKKKPKLKL